MRPAMDLSIRRATLHPYTCGGERAAIKSTHNVLQMDTAVVANRSPWRRQDVGDLDERLPRFIARASRKLAPLSHLMRPAEAILRVLQRYPSRRGVDPSPPPLIYALRFQDLHHGACLQFSDRVKGTVLRGCARIAQRRSVSHHHHVVYDVEAQRRRTILLFHC